MTKMKRDAQTGAPIYCCSICETDVEDQRDILILSDPDALPEAPTIVFVRPCCLEVFDVQTGRRWDRYSLQSRDARWLLPMI